MYEGLNGVMAFTAIGENLGQFSANGYHLSIVSTRDIFYG